MDAIIIALLATVVSVVVVLVGLKQSYRVVPPNEAHVVVTRSKGRKVYCTRKEGQTDVEYSGSSYWRIPIIQAISVIPLENIKIEIQGIALRDSAMAKFAGDVVAWLNIVNPLLASERIAKDVNFKEVDSDVSKVIQAVTRNMSMGSTLMDIMKKRKEFSATVESAVNEELDEWGMRVVELEIIHFVDIEGYENIKNLEERTASIISAETRKITAGQEKEASIVESTAKKETDVAKATNERTAREAQLSTQQAIGVKEQERDREIQMKEQERIKSVQEATATANAKKIEAEKANTVGTASYEKEKTILKAQADAEAKFQQGNADARITQAQGEAKANITKAVGLAEAEATTKRAEALKLYNEAGLSLEIIKAVQTVSIENVKNQSEALKTAKITVYMGAGENGFFDLKNSFNVSGFLNILKDQGIDVPKIFEKIGSNAVPVVDGEKIVSTVAKKVNE